MKRVAAVAGLTAFGLGLVAYLRPALVRLPVERLAVVLLGVTGLGLAVLAVRGRLRASGETAETGRPETTHPVPKPEGDLQAFVNRVDPVDHPVGLSLGERRALRTVAVEAVARFRNASREAARRTVDEGTWTDDPAGAAFLDDDGPSQSATDRARRLLTGWSPYRARADRAEAAIAELVGLDGTEGNSDERPGLLARLRRRYGAFDRVEDVDRPDAGSSVVRTTARWRGISAVALAAFAVGTLTREPSVILVGAVGVGYTAYARLGTTPSPALSADRTVSPTDPQSDETVAVSVTITNEGEGVLWDLRLVDGVPGSLAVADGTPRLATVLRPGESATVEYALDAKRGAHSFRPVRAMARDLSGSVETDACVAATGPDAVRCVPPLAAEAEVTVRDQPTRETGRRPTDIGGDGVEFHATRPYRRGDPLRRVDWNHRAKTGELATLEFREQRSVSVVCLVDTTTSAAAGPATDGTTAVDRCVDGARVVVDALLADGHRVGVAALGDADCWLGPGTGEQHRRRARELLATAPPFAPDGSGTDRLPLDWFDRFRAKLPAASQVVLFSPLCSPTVVAAARRLDAYGYPVTVISPGPTDPARDRIAGILRRFRVWDLRAAGVPVVDWGWDEPPALATARTAVRGATR